MKLFIKNILLFILFGLIAGELIVRIFSLNIDVPRSYVSKSGLIKFYPNQSGNYLNGKHIWKINQYGNYGPAPKSLDSAVITVIGDSYISNAMNPPECHQAVYLSQALPHKNFYPSSRDGASFMEYMEMTKALDSLKPQYQLLYVHHGDMTESIRELGRKPLTVQTALKTGTTTPALLQVSKFKEYLYHWKFMYFLYRNYLLMGKKGGNEFANNRDEVNPKKINYAYIEQLLQFSISNYKTNNIILVFSPDSDKKVTAIANKVGFKCIQLNTTDYQSWKLPNDSHWSCFGHQEAAKQTSEFLKTLP